MMSTEALPHHNSSIHASLGAVLLGNIISVFLSGVVAMQAVLYFRVYPKDPIKIKLIVAAVWMLDLAHSMMVTEANWSYLILNFGNLAIADTIFWSVAVSIALTACITFFVHCFFCYRILTLSKYNWFVTGPTFTLALARLAFALGTTSRMIMLKSYEDFIHAYSFVFTAGLTLATLVDILVAGSLIWYLNRNRSGFSAMDTVIDSITLYTVESGLLTSVVTIISLIFWLSMPHNLVFLGLHFAISKLYANAFLATLNARKGLRGRSGASYERSNHAMPVVFPTSFNRHSRYCGNQYASRHDPDGAITTKLEINVEKTIECDIAADPGSDGPAEESILSFSSPDKQNLED